MTTLSDRAETCVVFCRCMLRVLDSFGTEPEFNHAHYAQSKGHKTPWGKWNLNPQQFNTMFRKFGATKVQQECQLPGWFMLQHREVCWATTISYIIQLLAIPKKEIFLEGLAKGAQETSSVMLTHGPSSGRLKQSRRSST